MENKKFTFASMRHGHKLAVNEELGPLDLSGLTAAQQQKWKSAVERLGDKNPEIKYENLPLIEQKALELFNELPDHTTVLFTSSRYPRAKLLADLMSASLIELNEEKPEKDLNIAFLWEPKEMASNEESIHNLANIDPVANKILERMENIQKSEYPNDSLLADYLSEAGNRSHPNEDFIVFKATNDDLRSSDSVFRARGKLLKKQIQYVQAMYTDFDRPIFLLAAGHHSNLIALDVAYNNRRSYTSADEIPSPLTLWRVPSSKLKDK